MAAENFLVFEDCWPVAEARLRNALCHFELRLQEVDDVVQTTAERAFKRFLKQGFNDAEHVAAWAIRVGMNLAKDDSRTFQKRPTRSLTFFDAPDLIETDDLVAARLKRDAMLTEIAELSPEDQLILMGEIDGDGIRTESVRINVRRHRARKGLRKVWDRLGVLVGGWRARLGFQRSGAGEAGAAAALVASAVAVSIGVFAAIPDHDSATAPSRSAQAVVAPPLQATTPAARADSPELTNTQLRSVSSPTTPEPFLRVPFGTDPNGNPQTVDGRAQAEHERGVLACDRPAADPSANCLYYPELVVRLSELLAQLGIQTAPR